MSSIPTFPQVGEQWLECPICGEAHPGSKFVRHYRSLKLVCWQCDDQPSHADNLQYLNRGQEREDALPGKHAGQGESEN